MRLPELGARDIYNHTVVPFSHTGDDGFHCAHSSEEVGLHKSTGLAKFVMLENTARCEAGIVDEYLDRSMLGLSLTEDGLKVRTGDVKCDLFTSQLLDLVNGFGCH